MLMLVYWKRVLAVALVLLALVQKKYPGQILEVELEQEEYGDKDIWIYEIKMLTRRGRVIELEYDAATLELLDIYASLY
jgi:uncharacterized membrane protein YkoI